MGRGRAAVWWRRGMHGTHCALYDGVAFRMMSSQQ